jgi:hypothetical protein
MTRARINGLARDGLSGDWFLQNFRCGPIRLPIKCIVAIDFIKSYTQNYTKVPLQRIAEDNRKLITVILNCDKNVKTYHFVGSIEKDH